MRTPLSETRPTSFFRVGAPTHVVTLTQLITSVYFGQTHLGTPFQVSAWVRKFSLGSTRDDHFFGMRHVTSFELGFVIKV